MKTGWFRKPGRLRRIVGALVTGLCFVFGMLVTDAKAPSLPEGEAHMPGKREVQSTLEDRGEILPQCQIIQTMAFTRCGHSVTRRIAPGKAVEGMSFDEANAYYDLWQIEEFSGDRMSMRREIDLYCPMHQVLGVNEAGQLVLMQNVYGDGMAVHQEYRRSLTDFGEEIQGELVAGIGFDSVAEAEAWLSCH